MSERVIDQLRRYAGGEWRYDYRDLCQWHGTVNGAAIEVRRCAVLSPRYDGDDDSFETRWYAWSGKDCIACGWSVLTLCEEIVRKVARRDAGDGGGV